MKTKLTRMIAMVLAVLMLISCTACGNDTSERTDNGAVTTAPTTESTQGTTEPETLPSAPDAEVADPSEPTTEVTEPSEPATTPVEPEAPVTQPTEPEAPVTTPTEPNPLAPVVKNEYFNDANYEMVEGQLTVKPRHVYWEDGKLVAECFVINADAYIVHYVQVTNLALETPDGQRIAEAVFDYTHEDDVRFGSYYTHTFTFSGADIKIPNADLKNVVVQYGLSWQQTHNEYHNQEIVTYPMDGGWLPDHDAAVQEEKVDVRVRWAYWQDGMLNVRLNVANGTDVAITNVDVTNLTFTNANGEIASAVFGILQAVDYTNITVEPGCFVDVDITIGEEGSNNELINAQWDIQFTNGEVQPIDPFDGATDEQILACLEFSPAGRTPLNDDPGYTYMSETHVVGTLIDAELDIADVEVLYATVNGAPCEVYQTMDHGKISEIMDYEEWNAETFGCRELHNIFLVQSDTPIEVTDDRTDYVIVEHTIMFRVYLTNGEYRDVLYEDENYVLSIFGGGLMTDPECYE